MACSLRTPRICGHWAHVSWSSRRACLLCLAPTCLIWSRICAVTRVCLNCRIAPPSWRNCCSRCWIRISDRVPVWMRLWLVCDVIVMIRVRHGYANLATMPTPWKKSIRLEESRDWGVDHQFRAMSWVLPSCGRINRVRVNQMFSITLQRWFTM